MLRRRDEENGFRGILASDDLSEGRAEPGPVAVVDDVGRVGDERSVVRVDWSPPRRTG